MVWIKGHGHKRIIVLKNDMKGKADGHLSHRIIDLLSLDDDMISCVCFSKGKLLHP